MTCAVRYASRTGNTKKLAEAAAEAVNAEALSVEEDLQETADVLFLGSSVYAGSPDRAVTEFLGKNKEKIGKVVVFGSSASGKSTHAKLKACCDVLGITVSDAYFSCPGHFLFMHKERPNEKDLEDLKAFAKAQCS